MGKFFQTQNLNNQTLSTQKTKVAVVNDLLLRQPQEALPLALAPIIQEKIVEVIKEVKVVEVQTVEVIKEVFIDRPVDRIVEVIKEMPIEIVKEIKVIEEKIVQVPVEIIKNIETVIEKQVAKIPLWVWSIVGAETLAIIVLLIK